MEEFFNNERKKDFLNSQNLGAASIKNIRSVFRASKTFEDMNDKDLCDFNYEEYLSMFNIRNWGIYTTFMSKKTMITSYLNYCVSNGLCDSNNLREIDRLNPTDIKQKSKFETEYYKDFDDFHNTIKNVFSNIDPIEYENRICNIVILYLLWYGFEKEEIINLDNKDFNYKEGTITCKDSRRIVHIDNEEVLTLFENCKNAESYCRWHGKVWAYLKYKNPDKLIKSYRNDSIDIVDLRLRIWSSSQYIKNNLSVNNEYASKKFTDLGISNSGLYSRIKQLEDDGLIEVKHVFIPKINELLNIDLVTDFTNGNTTKFIKNYKKWKNYFYK